MNNLIFNYVSRETLSLLKEYVTLIEQWNRKTGLVQQNTLEHIWERHILDSLQLATYFENKDQSILDIGSGGGLPGIIIAISGYTNVTLCESNIRKVVFLEEVVRKLNLPVKVIHDRIENINQHYDIITSRACASLEKLLGFMKNVSRETGSFGVFPKGKTALLEIEEARKTWNFNAELFPSITSDEGTIIVVRNLKVKD
jgi:16S rRNA (guanine527-N7)-methyltransferase